MELKREEILNREKELRQNLELDIERRIEFTRVLVHELKTPLTPIIAASELIMDEIPDGPLFRLARSINKGTNTLNYRIGQLLDVARGEVGMLELNRKNINIIQLLRKVSEDMTPEATIHAHSFDFKVPRSLPKVLIDEERITQVVVNLLDNAIKYTPDGGKITLTASIKNKGLVVEIEDTGPGLSIDQQQHIFDSYYRNESDIKYGRGLGLGLAISKMLIELHGGKIWVESEVGKGSSFSFSLQQTTSPRG